MMQAVEKRKPRKINFTRHLEQGTWKSLWSQILISGMRDLHSMTFLDHSKHAFNKINYERARFVTNARCKVMS